MAAFDSDAFDTDAFDSDAFDFGDETDIDGSGTLTNITNITNIFMRVGAVVLILLGG